MATASDNKNKARLEARISPETKALLQKAADIEGCTLTSFVVTSVQKEAFRVIEQHQRLKLSLEDSKAFADALLNPQEPNEALKAASLRHEHIISA